MRKRKKSPFWVIRELFHRVLVFVCAAGLTLLFFLVLPLMQTLTKPPANDLIVRTVDTAKLDAPDPPLESEPEEEPEPEPEPPKLMEDAPPLDLSQLEVPISPDRVRLTQGELKLWNDPEFKFRG